MTMRYTETEKWERDKWFKRLSVEGKLAFVYLYENCDCAGFLEIDEAEIAHKTGLPQSEQLNALKLKTVGEVLQEIKRGYVREGDYIWVRNFLYYQKNLPLNPNNNCHAGILRRIQARKSFGKKVLCLIDKQIKDRGLQGANQGLMRRTGNGNGKSKGRGKGKGKRGKALAAAAVFEPGYADELVRLWNKKCSLKTVGGAEILAVERELCVLLESVEIGLDYPGVEKAVDNYSKATKLPNSRAGQYRLAAFLRRLGTEDGKCYREGYFNLPNFGEAATTQSRVERIKKFRKDG